MRLVYDHSTGANAVSVQCYCCGTWHRLADMVSDLHGPAFQAYYCATCQPEGPVAACDRPGCTRCGNW
jgi:hypothetical protein